MLNILNNPKYVHKCDQAFLVQGVSKAMEVLGKKDRLNYNSDRFYDANTVL